MLTKTMLKMRDRIKTDNRTKTITTDKSSTKNNSIKTKTITTKENKMAIKTIEIGTKNQILNLMPS